jgi:hypothetical protein
MKLEDRLVQAFSRLSHSVLISLKPKVVNLRIKLVPKLAIVTHDEDFIILSATDHISLLVGQTSP